MLISNVLDIADALVDVIVLGLVAWDLWDIRRMDADDDMDKEELEAIVAKLQKARDN